MSKEVDNRVVEMRFDNTDFEKNCDTTLKSLDKLDNALRFKDAQKGFNELEKSSDKVTFGGLSKSLDSVTMKIDTLQAVAIGVLTNITNKAVDAAAIFAKSLSIDQVLSGWSKYEEKTNAVQMIVNQGYALQEVEAQMEKLNWFTDETSYNFTDMANNIGKFTAQGQDLERSTTAMEGISTWAALSGAGINGASRAMYNLSQALGMGAVRVQDWMSIENANMATEEFKNTVIETAKELGKLSEDTTVTAANFRSTLSEEWFDADVLMATLEKYGSFTDKLNEATEATGLTASEMLRYIEKYKTGSADLSAVTGENASAIVQYVKELGDSEYELGYKAFKAAQEAKTFTDAINATKDAVSTSWLNVFQTIFGTYDTAKVFWTDLANELYDVFAEPVNEINELLSGAFTSSWERLSKKISGSTVIDTNDFLTSLQEVGIKYGKITQEMVDDAGSLEATFQNGWVSTNDMILVVDKYIDKLKGMSDAELEASGYTRTDIRDLQIFRAELATTGSEAQNLTKTLDRMSARQNFTDAFWNVFNALKGVIQAVKEGFREIFPQKTVDDIVNFSAKVKELTERLNLFEEDGETLNATGIKIRDTFKGVFAVFGIVKEILSKVSQILSPIFGQSSGLLDIILSITAAIGNWLAKLRDWIKESEALNKVIGWMTSAVQFLVDVVKMVYEEASKAFDWLSTNVFGPVIDWLDKMFSKIKTDGEDSRSLLDKIKSVIESIATAVATAYNAVVNFFNGIGQWLKDSGIWDKIVSFFDSVKKGLSDIWDILSKGATDGSLLGWLLAISGLIAEWEVAKTLKSYITSITNFVDRLAHVAKSFSEFMDTITESLEKMQKRIKYKIIKDIAIAVLLLSVSLAIIASTFANNKDAAIYGTAVIVGLIAALAGVSKLIEKMDIDPKKISKQILAMVPLAAAILVAALAFKILASIDPDSIWSAIAALTVISGALIAAAKILDSLSSSGGAIVKAASGILIFAVAILVLAGASKIFATMEWSELAKAGTAITVLAGILVAAAELLSRINGGAVIKASSGLLIFAVALGILSLVSKIFATMEWGELAKAGTAIAVLAGILVAAAELLSRLDGGAVIKASSGLLLFSVALGILSLIAKIFATMEWEELLKAGIAITVLAGILVAAAELLSRLDSGAVVKASSGLLIFSVAVGILAIITLILTTINWSESWAAGVALVAIVGVLIIAAELLSRVDSSALMKSALALLVFTGAVATLAAVLVVLSLIDTTSALIGAAAIAGLIVVFIALAALINKMGLIDELAKFATVLLEFGAAAALIGVGLLSTAAAVYVLLEAIMKFSSWLIENPLTFVTAIQIAMEAVKEVIISFLNGLKEIIVQFFKNIIEGFAEIIEFIATLTPTLKEPIKQILSDIADVLKAWIPMVGEIIEVLIITIATVIKNTSPYIASATKQVVGDVIDTIASLIPKFTELIVALIDSALTLMPKFTELTIAITDNIIETIYQTGPRLILVLLSLIDDLLTAVMNNIEHFTELGLQIAINLINGIAAKIGDVIQAGVNLVLNLIQGIADALNDENNQERFRKAFVDLIVGVIKTVFTSFKIIGDIGKRAWEFMKSVWNEHIKPKFNEIKDKVKEIGHNIIEGIKEGISSKIEALKEKCKEVTDAITGKIKDLLNIKSPSRVMAEIGKYTILGMAKGIGDNAKTAVKSITDLGKSMIDTTSTIAYRIAEALDQDMDISPTISPVMDLSNIQNGVRSIDSMMNGSRSITGTVSIAGNAVSGFNKNLGIKNSNALTSESIKTAAPGNAFNNTFNITSNNPREVAHEVSRIIARQVERKDEQWA